MAMIPWRNKRRSEVEEAPMSDRGESAPLTMWENLGGELNRTFGRLMDNPLNLLSQGLDRIRGWVPSVDVSETDTHVRVRAEVPGVDPADLDIAVMGNTLEISGKKETKQDRNDENTYYSERHFGSFRRMVQLPVAVLHDDVQAHYKDGVLTIDLPKDRAASRRRVAVNVQRQEQR